METQEEIPNDAANIAAFFYTETLLVAAVAIQAFITANRGELQRLSDMLNDASGDSRRCGLMMLKAMNRIDSGDIPEIPAMELVGGASNVSKEALVVASFMLARILPKEVNHLSSLLSDAEMGQLDAAISDAFSKMQASAKFPICEICGHVMAHCGVSVHTCPNCGRKDKVDV